MAITGFKPVLGGLTLGTGGFSLSGDDAGFCHAILRKATGGQPAQLESLTRTRVPGHSPDVPGQGGTASKRTGRRAGIRSEADGAGIKPPRGARAKRNAAAGTGEEHGEPPSSMPGSPTHRTKAEAGVRVEVVRAGGAERTGLSHAPFVPYPFRADLQVGVSPGLQVGKLPDSLRLDSGWRAAKVFLGLFNRVPWAYQKIWPAGAHAAQDSPALRWRRMTPDPEGGALPGARHASEGAALRSGAELLALKRRRRSHTG